MTREQYNFPECGTITIMTGSLCLSVLTTLSAHSVQQIYLHHTVFSLLPIQNTLYLLPLAPQNLRPLLFHLLSCIHAISIHLFARTSTNSPAVPLSESTFQVPTLLVHSQVTIIFVVSVCLFVCLFVCLCRVFLSRL